MKKRSLILLNTKGCCFFCLRQIVKQENDSDFEASETGSCLFSLYSLCSYLKISLNGEVGEELKQFSTGVKSEDMQEVEVEVSSCNSCMIMGKQFTELFMELERIKKETDKCVGTLHMEMASVGEYPEVVQNYNERMEGEDSQGQIRIVDKLRNEITCKSSSHNSCHVPDAQLTKAIGNKTYRRLRIISDDEDSEPAIPSTSPLFKNDLHELEDSSPEDSPPWTPSSHSPLTIEDDVKPLVAKSTRPYKCNRCNKSFIAQLFLKRHRKQCNPRNTKQETIVLSSTAKIFKCDLCNTPFSRKANLRRHKKECTGQPSDRLKRRKVLKTFRKKGSRSIYNPETGKYKCSACFEEFSTSSGVLHHYNSVHLQRKYECDVCGAVYLRAYRLTVHKRTCNGIRPKSNLAGTNPVKRLGPGPTLVRIGKDFVRNSSTGKYDCATCSESFTSRTTIRLHVISQHFKLFQCETCKKSFQSKVYLASHRKKKNCREADATPAKKPRKQVKNSPGRKRSNVKSTARPKMSVFNHESGMYKCKLCPEEFKSRMLCVAHYEKDHLQLVSQCDICNRVFKTRGMLAIHKQYCGVDPKPNQDEVKAHVCEDCGKQYKSRTCLFEHRLAVHSGQKYFCKFCNKQFAGRKTLWYHENRSSCGEGAPKYVESPPVLAKYVIKDENKIKCDICNIAGFDSNLSKEYLKHREECLREKNEQEQRRKAKTIEEQGASTQPEARKRKPPNKNRPSLQPAACPICGKWFSKRCGVTEHIKLVHENRRKYVCDDCGKSFKDHTQFKRHQDAVHLGKTFPCEKCKSEFKSWNTLRYHKKKCGKESQGQSVEVPGQSGSNFEDFNPFQ